MVAGQETDATVAFSVALPAGDSGRRSVSVEQETDARVAFSVALPAGDSGRRSVSVELYVSCCVTFSPLPPLQREREREREREGPFFTSCSQVETSIYSNHNYNTTSWSMMGLLVQNIPVSFCWFCTGLKKILSNAQS